MSDWDVFISHANEDQVAVVDPLAELLRQAGVRVWVDAQELRLGDSLTGKINKGLASARYGVVVLSPSFLAKEWPKRELAALLSMEIQHGKRILPVLHELRFDDLLREYPLMADRVCVSTSGGLGNVALEIQRATGFDTPSPAEPSLTSSPAVGSSIGSYQIETHVGTGGSGAVFRVHAAAYPIPLALKLFHPLQPQYAHLFSLFARGFRAVASVRHPNVIAVHDHGAVEYQGRQRAYFTMDLIDGQPLDVWSRGIRENRFLTLLPVFRQLAAALTAAHETTYVDELGFQVGGVLHGDLKPANVLVDESGDVRLIDFLQVDVQRLIDQQITPLRHAESITAVMGTPGFMAPEQERHGVVTAATDVYGLGITFAHALAPEKMRNPLRNLYESSEVPDSFRQFVISMIATRPEERPQTARQALERIELELR